MNNAKYADAIHKIIVQVTDSYIKKYGISDETELLIKAEVTKRVQPLLVKLIKLGLTL